MENMNFGLEQRDANITKNNLNSPSTLLIVQDISEVSGELELPLSPPSPTPADSPLHNGSSSTATTQSHWEAASFPSTMRPIIVIYPTSKYYML